MKNTLRQFAYVAAITGFAVWLQGCAGPAPETPPSSSIGVRTTRVTPPGQQQQRCSMRLQISLSPAGSMTRLDQDLADIGRNLGVTLDVVQSMGRNRHMINMRGEGTQRVCEDAFEQLRMDVRIESAQRF